jgi:hypothetical protein
MKRLRFLVIFATLVLGGVTSSAADEPAYVSREVRGWTLLVRGELMEPGRREATESALGLIAEQLGDVARLIPPPALAKLREVRIYLSPPYPGVGPKAEYHSDAGWLRANGRDPAMARSVEFTNLAILDREVRRMPMLTLHELAHAYHHQVLGFDHAGIKETFAKARAAGTYEAVARRDWQGRETRGVRAYALTNDKEYFAETTEAFFGRNDFFPFDRAELERADPAACEMLRQAWGLPAR